MTNLMYAIKAIRTMSQEQLDEFLGFIAENELSKDIDGLKQDILHIRGEQDVINAESI